MGNIFAFLRVSSSVQVRVVARRTMASAGKRKITWSCTKYVAVISAHRLSIWQKGSGLNIETCQFYISYLKAWPVHYLFDTSHMKNQYPSFPMDAVRGADLTQRHNAGLFLTQSLSQSMMFSHYILASIVLCRIWLLIHDLTSMVSGLTNTGGTACLLRRRISNKRWIRILYNFKVAQRKKSNR